MQVAPNDNDIATSPASCALKIDGLSHAEYVKLNIFLRPVRIERTNESMVGDESTSRFTPIGIPKLLMGGPTLPQ